MLIWNWLIKFTVLLLFTESKPLNSLWFTAMLTILLTMALSSPAFFSTTHSSSSSSSTSVKLLHSHHHSFTHFHFPTTTPTIHTIFSSTASPPSEKWRAKVSFFPAFLNRGRKDAKTLKDELLDAIEPLDRGADATPEDQQRVDQVWFAFSFIWFLGSLFCSY